MSKKQKTIEELLKEALVPEDERPYDVPENWVWTRIGLYLENHDGARIPISSKERGNINGDIPYYGASGVIDYVDNWTHEGKYVLIGEDGANLLTRTKPISFIAKGRFWVNNHAHVLKCTNGTPEEYVSNYVNSISLREFVTGSAQPKLTQKNLNNIPLPIPPLNEQKRITEKVECLLSKIEEAKQLIEEAKETFEIRRAAIIKTILKEGLSNDKLSIGWRKIKIKDLFTIFGGGTPSKTKEEYWNGKIPWISAKDMKTTFISGTMDYITEEGLKNSSAKLAKRGSVAMVVRSGILQRTLPVAFLLSECTVNQDLKVFDSGDELINKYFMWYVKGNEKSLLHNYSKSGTTVNSIEFEKFKTHEILLPPVDVLKRKIDKVESAIEKEESANEILNMADSIEALKQSILSRAFRGELGTNDPSEESAIELLKEVLQEQVE